MKVAIIGLGSMGKRRIRCLHALGITDLVGFDVRADRRAEAERLYQIPTVTTLDGASLDGVRAAIISVPPDIHATYMHKCSRAGVHYFIEASVLDDSFDRLLEEASSRALVAAPSQTMRFHPAVRHITRMVQGGELGEICHFIYHFGQYLPDWHTYEHVRDFYVSNPITGAAREIVPFELTWLVRCFGWPTAVSARVAKTRRIEGAEEIDDTYALTLEFPHPGILVVDVVSRAATRQLTIAGTDKHLRWDWNSQQIQVFDPLAGTWSTVNYDAGLAAPGYNANIGEMMYIDETRAFIDACRGGASFPATLSEDARVLRILRAAEVSSHSGARQCLS